jgi:hypothetical protein
MTNRWDELSKALASGVPRRKALWMFGSALVGSILIGGRFEKAFAGGSGNSACAKFCASVFGASTPAAGKCTSDAAHKRGLCYTCGPASPGGGVTPSSVCCTRNARNFCSSYSTTTCPIVVNGTPVC